MARSLTVLVTGASTGLGLALSRQLLATPHRLILTARPSSLERFAEHGIVEDQRVHLRPLDITSAEQRHAVVEEAEARWGGVDVLINNAGVMMRSVLEHVDDEERLAQLDVNFLSPMDLIRLVLPSMRRRRSGRIINVSSVGGMMAMPTMAAYSASKFALEGATESLYYEVRPWNIRVSLVQPGFIHSDSYRHVRLTHDSQHSLVDLYEPYHAHYENMAPFIDRLMRWSRATPEGVAKVIIKTMTRRSPPLRVAGTIDAYLFGAMRRLLPRPFYHWLLYKFLPSAKTWGRRLDAPVATPLLAMPRRRRPVTSPDEWSWRYLERGPVPVQVAAKESWEHAPAALEHFRVGGRAPVERS